MPLKMDHDWHGRKGRMKKTTKGVGDLDGNGLYKYCNMGLVMNA